MQMRLTVTACAILFAFSAAAHPPVALVIDSKGNVFYSDLEQVWRIAPGGVKSVAVPNVHTHELYLDAQDNLFGEHLWYEGDATKKWGFYVWKRDAAGRVSMVKPRTVGFRTNYSFVRDRAGNMYFADTERGQIRKIAPDGKVSLVAGELKQMRWLHATPGGTVYTIDGSDLVRIRDGRAVRLVRNVVKTSILRAYVDFRHAIMGIWTDAAENVYLADYANGEIKRVTPAGVVSKFADSTMPWSPTGGTFAPNGDLWILEATLTNQVRVRKVDARQLPRR
jgi:hypothetical protein